MPSYVLYNNTATVSRVVQAHKMSHTDASHDTAAAKVFCISELLLTITDQLDAPSLWRLTHARRAFKNQILKSPDLRQRLYLDSTEGGLLVWEGYPTENSVYSTFQPAHCEVIDKIESAKIQMCRPVHFNDILPSLWLGSCREKPDIVSLVCGYGQEAYCNWSGITAEFECLEMFITQPKTTGVKLCNHVHLENPEGVRLRDIWEATGGQKTNPEVGCVNLKVSLEDWIKPVISNSESTLLKEMGHHPSVRFPRPNRQKRTEERLESISNERMIEAVKSHEEYNRSISRRAQRVVSARVMGSDRACWCTKLAGRGSTLTTQKRGSKWSAIRNAPLQRGWPSRFDSEEDDDEVVGSQDEDASDDEDQEDDAPS